MTRFGVHLRLLLKACHHACLSVIAPGAIACGRHPICVEIHGGLLPW